MGESTDRIKVRMPSRSTGSSSVQRRKLSRFRRTPRVARPMRWVSLHHHSTYSYLDGYRLPQAHAERAVELGMSALALTEHGNVSSHVKLELAGRQEKLPSGAPNPAFGLKPIFGVELYTAPEKSRKKNHLTVLATDVEGYRNMLRLVSRTFAEGFHYLPTANEALLDEHVEGLVVLSGCQSGLLFTSLVGGKMIEREDANYKRAKDVARAYKRRYGDNYFIEVQAFPELEDTRRANPGLARLASELDIPLVATMDCHYTLPSDRGMQMVLHNIRGHGKETLEEQVQSWGYNVALCPPLNDAAIIRRLVATGLTRAEAQSAVLSTEQIAQNCTVELPKLPLLRYPVSKEDGDALEVWRRWIREGWYFRGCDRLPKQLRDQYKERLRYEMGIIEQKDFVDYFLLVSDATRWAKDNGIAVGPARGSAAASLVCWLLRITEVDPMLYSNLVFERFIDITRQDLPDIDLDFDSERRQELTSYLVAKYGRECVNNIGTFSTFKAKMSLDDTARVFHIPQFEVEKVKDVLIERSSGDLRASATIEDTVDQFDAAREVFEKYPELAIAMDLEGNVKGFGIHAAGIVISNGPITDVCAVYEREVHDEMRKVISLDKYDAERMGLVKMDFLGLSNMTFMQHACSELGWSLDDLYGLPLDDPVVIDGFRRNDVVGIFQFDGRACRYVCGALAPDSFAEICDITALARPGPLHNGAANEYIDIKRGAKLPEEIHPSLSAITEGTYSQVVYQEQILRIVREIGNFDWTHASYIRKIISRKIGEQEFNRQWGRFWEGAQELHPDMSEETAKQIWGLCITAGSYAFNAAHSVAYGMLGYWTMYIKQHYPSLFYSAALQTMDKKKHQDLIRDAVRHRVEIRSPHPKYSGVTWKQEGEHAIRAGYEQIPGIGDKTSTQIAAFVEEHGGLEDWGDLTVIKGIGEKTIEKARSFSEAEDPFDAMWLDRTIARVKEELKAGQLWGHDRRGKFIRLPSPTHVASDLPYSRGVDLDVVWLGTIHTRNVRDIFEYNRAKTGVELKREEVKDPDLNEWMVMVGDDESDQMGLRVDRWTYPKYRDALWGMRPGEDLLLVRGIKPGWMPTRQITIRELWVLNPE